MAAYRDLFIRINMNLYSLELKRLHTKIYPSWLTQNSTYWNSEVCTQRSIHRLNRFHTDNIAQSNEELKRRSVVVQVAAYKQKKQTLCKALRFFRQNPAWNNQYSPNKHCYVAVAAVLLIMISNLTIIISSCNISKSWYHSHPLASLLMRCC